MVGGIPRPGVDFGQDRRSRSKRRFFLQRYGTLIGATRSENTVGPKFGKLSFVYTLLRGSPLSARLPPFKAPDYWRLFFIERNPQAAHGPPSLAQGFLPCAQTAIRSLPAWPWLGKSSKARLLNWGNQRATCGQCKGQVRLPLYSTHCIGYRAFTGHRGERRGAQCSQIGS